MNDSSRRPDDEAALQGIAVVGIAARFPGAQDAARFWDNLRAGVESITQFGRDELAAAGVDPVELADPRYVRAKGVLPGADLFDAAFFGFTPREAEVMDPQHRVFLECAWEALEDAGCDARREPGRIGVWAGSGAAGYLIANLLPDRARLEALGALQVMLVNDRDFLATRTSFALDLRGPSVAVQTACSTSLVAVHMACQSLLAGECDVALAGGVSIGVPLASGYLYQEGGVMSPDGHCRAFDAAAAGSVEGNGCGVVALRRLGDALAAGDRIHAVIRGSAVNNDGAARAGFTAPGVDGQAEVIAESLMMADVDPATIGYVEAHGSGTPLGDPIEIAALTEAFRSAGGTALPPGSCGVGSVKTNIGHCNTAAGVAGLIKAVLALEHRTIPPSLHFRQPNPRIDFAGSPFFVPAAAAPWPRPASSLPSLRSPRRAGVSSFGLGGTNAHVILEEAPAAEPTAPPSRQAQLLVLSARTPGALAAAAERLAAHLGAPPEENPVDGGGGPAAEAGPLLADVAWTLQTGRRTFEHRRFVVASDPREAAAALTAGPAQTGRAAGAASRPVVFLCAGIGDQYPGMARGLYDTEPVFREAVDRCAERLAPALGADLRAVLWPAAKADGIREPAAEAAGTAGLLAAAGRSGPAAGIPGPGTFGAVSTAAASAGAAGPDLRAMLRRGGAAAGAGTALLVAPPTVAEAADLATAGVATDPDIAAAAQAAAAGLQRTLFAQPACFVVEYALASLVLSWGIEPQALLGYSVGEIVAACLAGSLSLDQALDLVAARARQVEELPAGAMVAVPLPEAEVRPLLVPGTSLAAVNGPHLCVAAGSGEAVTALERRLADRGVASIRMRTTHAFHSPMMEPAATAIAGMAAATAMRPPRIPWLSNVTGGWITAAEIGDPGYWARQLRSPVRFADGLAELLREPDRVFVEIGPGATLSTLVQQMPASPTSLNVAAGAAPSVGESQGRAPREGRDGERTAVPTLRRGDEAGADSAVLLAAVGRLWAAGVAIDWPRFHGGEPRRRVGLPTYPFERRRHWLEPPVGQAAAAGAVGQGAGLPAGPGAPAAVSPDALAVPASSADPGDWFWVPSWQAMPLMAPPAGGVAAGTAPPAGAEPEAAQRVEARWLLFVGDAADGSGGGALGQRLAERLRAAGNRVTTVAMSPAPAPAATAAGGGAATGPGLQRLGEDAYAIDPARRKDYDALLAEIGEIGNLGGKDGGPPLNVLHLWGLTAGGLPGGAAGAPPTAADPVPAAAPAPAEPPAAALSAGLVSLTLLAQAVAALPHHHPSPGAAAPAHPPVRLVVAANGLTALLDGDRVQPAKAAVLGALKVVRQEVPRLAVAAVDVEVPLAGSVAQERLAEQLIAEVRAVAAAAPGSLVALRGSRRFVRGFAPAHLATGAAGEGLLRPGAAYLISGAEQGPGLGIAEHLLRHLDARVAVVLPPDLAPDVPAAGRLAALAGEVDAGRLLVLHAAAGDSAAMAGALQQARERWGPLRGAFWTGTGAPGSLLQMKTAESLRASLAPVAAGAEVLVAAFAAAGSVPGDSSASAADAGGGNSPAAGAGAAGATDARRAGEAARGATEPAETADGGPPPFVLLSSTATAVTGGLGQLDLATGGAYLEALAQVEGEPGAPLVLTAHWEPYLWGGWLVASVAGGMAGVSAAEVEEALRANAIAEERSGEALERLLARPLPAVVVTARNLHGLIAEADSITMDSWQSPAGLGAAGMAGGVAGGARGPRPALPTPYEAPRDELEEQLAAIWQELFGIEPIGRDDSFLELGGHSLLAIQIVTQVRQVLDADLPVTAVFEAPTVAQLGAAVRQARGEADPAALEELLAMVEGLSPEEAAARLAELAEAEA